MQIIIVGCGKVGRTLAEQLQEEESDITLIDVSSNVITSLQDDIDAMGIVGNGASINTLVEAGIENADILIAVTGSDEMNLLCCLIAQKTGHCQTIARVRNPIYAKENGIHTLMLDTPHNTVRAHRFYEKAGFRKVSENELPVRFSHPYADCDFFLLEL